MPPNSNLHPKTSYIKALIIKSETEIRPTDDTSGGQHTANTLLPINFMGEKYAEHSNGVVYEMSLDSSKPLLHALPSSKVTAVKENRTDQNSFMIDKVVESANNVAYKTIINSSKPLVDQLAATKPIQMMKTSELNTTDMLLQQKIPSPDSKTETESIKTTSSKTIAEIVIDSASSGSQKRSVESGYPYKDITVANTVDKLSEHDHEIKSKQDDVVRKVREVSCDNRYEDADGDCQSLRVASICPWREVWRYNEWTVECLTCKPTVGCDDNCLLTCQHSYVVINGEHRAVACVAAMPCILNANNQHQ